ncbi:uncharacterized protein [Macrobrachium rosenbergii]|uniref:uncharacterized protein n=1 Tax=Macrobrachium rosenbergii TaxID=79674 RepID=UPI0034D5DC34
MISGYVIEDHAYSPYNHGEPFFQNVHPRRFPEPRKDVADGPLHPAQSLNEHSGIHDGVRGGGSGTEADDGTPKSEGTKFSFPDGRLLAAAAASSSGSVLDDHWAKMQTKLGTQDAEAPPIIALWDLLLLVMRADLYLPSTNRTLVQNEQCVADVETIYKPGTGEQWSTALRMIDSWGKVPDGLLWGNSQAAGSFDECLSTRGGAAAAKPRRQGAGSGGFKGSTAHLLRDR